MSHVRYIVVVGDPAEEALHLLPDEADIRVVVVDNLQQVKQEAQKAQIDGLVLPDKISGAQLRDLSHVVDESKTLMIAGAPSVQAAVDSMQWLFSQGDGKETHRGLQEFRELTLKDCIKFKFREFVRNMKASSATSLHGTLIQALEQPLIQHALRETNGNQVQAAQLLGMNRNTLRKKITEYGITVTRRSPSRQSTES